MLAVKMRGDDDGLIWNFEAKAFFFFPTFLFPFPLPCPALHPVLPSSGIILRGNYDEV